MRKSAIMTLAGMSMALIGNVALADEATDPAVKARTAIMQLYANNIGQLGAMAKGNVEYNAEAAMKAANNLALLVQLDQSTLWPQGTDNASMVGTRALPDLWKNFPDVMTKGESLGAAVTAMQGAAGTDLAALQGAMGGLGGACQACHKAYRAPDE
ncbi:cytochrome c [Aliiroseovarius sp. KMU-50]|uniref:Cytochrome c n=1 Tax=Aliiroseovarius salicola TaxID=3009082 RepID=A0ABT4VXZ1_9RHOB|nr:cytochrome c [Aliiroseovarius sp. KMU-50]MDA5093114.1 cytochrome c [Aliiroseovarius sp. KMU-50]